MYCNNFGTNLDQISGKYLIKFNFHIKIEIGIFKISNMPKFQQILSTFDFGTNLGLTAGKYFLKIIFDIKIKIGIFEISIAPNFSKF